MPANIFRSQSPWLHGTGIFTYMDGLYLMVHVYIYSSPIGAASGNMSWSVSATAGSRVETLGRAFSFQCLGIQDVAPVDLGEQKISVGEWKKVRFTNLGLVDEWDGCQHLPRGAK